MNTFHNITRRFWVLAMIVSVSGSFSATVLAAQLTITSISGWTAIDANNQVIINNGKWTGQPMKNPSSDAYKDMLAIESQNSAAEFVINGTNFGTQIGSVQFLGPDLRPVPAVTVAIKPGSWSNKQVIVSAKTPYNFTFANPGYVRVSRDKNPPPMSYDGAATFWVKGFVGVIQTRGYGQCTWYVAKRRLDAGKVIPPRAYAQTGNITAAYVPHLWDELLYNTVHVAIITSDPGLPSKKGDGSLTWTFTVSEMNARTDEQVTSIPKIFTVRNGAIITPIGSVNTKLTATGYWQ